MNSLISIVVPVYKVEQYLKNCIDSVLRQTYTNWELILVDDGSPDTCPVICDEYAQKDGRIKVIHKENGGLSSARNAGLNIIRGEYVTFLDSDDFWYDEYLSTLLGICEKYDADIVQCGFVRGQDTAFPVLDKKIQEKVYDNRSVFISQAVNIIMCGKIYRSELFDNIRMPIGKINEDDFTSWKLYYKARKIVVTDAPYYYYTYNGTSIMATQNKKPRLDFFEAYDERITFFKKKGDFVLEELSVFQFCKALLLTSGNPNLTEMQKLQIARAYQENWHSIRKSNYVPFKFRIIFSLFAVMPQLTLKIIKKLR